MCVRVQIAGVLWGILTPRAFAPASRRRYTMNWDRIEGNWKQLKGSVKE